MTLVLPAPLGPSRPSTSPRATVKETSSTAVPASVPLAQPGAPDRRGRRQLREELPPPRCLGVSRRTAGRQRRRATDSSSSALSDPATPVITPSSTQTTPAKSPLREVSTVASSPFDVGRGAGHQLGRHGQRAASRVRGEAAQLLREPLRQAGQGQQVVAHRLERRRPRRSPPGRPRGRRRASAHRSAAPRSPRRRDRPGAGAGLPSSPGGTGGRTSPSSAAACAAFSAENVNVALTTPAAWYVRVPGHAVGELGHLGDVEAGERLARPRRRPPARLVGAGDLERRRRRRGRARLRTRSLLMGSPRSGRPARCGRSAASRWRPRRRRR